MSISSLIKQLTQLSEDIVSDEDLKPNGWKPPETITKDTRPMSSLQNGFEPEEPAPSPTPITGFDYFKQRGKPFASVSVNVFNGKTEFRVAVYSGNILDNQAPEVIFNSKILAPEDMFRTLLKYNLAYDDLHFNYPKDRAAYQKSFDEYFESASKKEVDSVNSQAEKYIQERSMNDILPTSRTKANTAVLATDPDANWVLVEYIDDKWYITPRTGAKADDTKIFDTTELLVKFLFSNGYDAKTIVFSPKNDNIALMTYVDEVKQIIKQSK